MWLRRRWRGQIQLEITFSPSVSPPLPLLLPLLPQPRLHRYLGGRTRPASRGQESRTAATWSLHDDLYPDARCAPTVSCFGHAAPRAPTVEETQKKHGPVTVKLGKDPTVETGFLPDRGREAEEQAERERLKKQWLCEQELIKNEPLTITYSYWDGTGHRRVIQPIKLAQLWTAVCKLI
ncbi:hypothetical protein E2562_002720 [Oryza meyeriana var. granulata]|uniref:Protein FAM50 homolog n=1 Tax=Oryza meyeriana var. granulata TaxID=110450 RepID=A0A6G1BQI9_9ORYZ|nr:hypothetical protein E2562_002720 [Oryza meyeriana var. granulata]